jgi:hypothetical protein
MNNSSSHKFSSTAQRNANAGKDLPLARTKTGSAKFIDLPGGSLADQTESLDVVISN